MTHQDTGDDIAWDDLHPETRRLLSRRRMLGTSGKLAASFAVFGGMLTVVGCSKDDGSVDASATTTAAPPTTAAATTSTAKATTTTTEAMMTPAADSLYSRLGGNAAITAVVGDFVTERVANDARINHFFANVDLTTLQRLLVEQIGSATGGPEVYTGRSMEEAHAGLGISVADFNALVEDLVMSLDEFKVPEAEKTELLDALGPMQSQIVTA
jgi:hemoglobin